MEQQQSGSSFGTPMVLSIKIKLSRLIMTCISFWLWLYAYTPFTNLPMVYEIYSTLWVIEIMFVYYFAITNLLSNGFVVSRVVRSCIISMGMICHLSYLMESTSSRKLHADIEQKFNQIEMCLNEKLNLKTTPIDNIWNKAFPNLYLILVTFCANVIIIYTIVLEQNINGVVNIVFWIYFPNALAGQIRIVEFLTHIIRVNRSACIVLSTINEIGERNLRHIFKPLFKVSIKNNFVEVLPQDDSEDESQIMILKSIYTDIFALFKLLNETYGWSLLCFTTIYFIYFLFHSYWFFVALVSLNGFKIIHHMAFLIVIFSFLTAMCWRCQKSFNYSRNIGCLIFKLVKPLGNKRYNDLISEFSLQTLHQRFVITAKEFFNLNLNLLGSMVAAIVTYLVILIQFMLSEGTDQKHANTTVIPPIITNNSYNFSARKIIENVVTTVLTTDISERT